MTPSRLPTAVDSAGSGQRTSTSWTVALPLGGVRHQLLAEDLFKEALVRERRRADRQGPPFAVLVLDRGNNRPSADFWSAVVRTLAEVQGDTDVVGWLERDTVLGVLLQEVSGSAALEMMHRVRRELVSWLGDAAVFAASIRLYSHGDQPDAGAAPLTSVDLLLEGFVERRQDRAREAAKRGLDIVGSVVLLALSAPVLLGVLLAVKLTSPGPALFKQMRVGRKGKPFTMFKVRTMYSDATDTMHRAYATWFIASSGKEPRTRGNEVFKLTDDPRVTPAGRFLRKTSLDELPQFWNALRGDMSLVGPRPSLPFEFEQYQPWHRRRVLEVKPGITGLWQVNGRSSTTFDEMVRLDLRYARSYSLWTDIKILAATPRAVFSGKGAW